jgi:uncharacterized damage-inducible protein DinB
MQIQSTVSQEFIAHSIYQMELNLPRIEKCFAQLTEAEVWQRPNSESNSIGNLIVHLSGNIQQWIVSSIGGATDIRQRDEEFEMQEGLSQKELYELLASTIQAAVDAIQNLTEQDLLKKQSVQGYQYSALGNILHVVEHLSYHIGQIAYWTKVMKASDLGFYDDNDSLNTINEI